MDNRAEMYACMAMFAIGSHEMNNSLYTTVNFIVQVYTMTCRETPYDKLMYM